MKNGNFKKIGLVLLAVFLAGLFSANIVGAGQNRCLPDWSSTPIVIDKEMKRIEFAPGDSFTVEASYKYASSCKNYVPAVFSWQALKNNVLTNDIVFSDSHAKKTTAMVALNAKTGDRVTIRGILTFADDPNEQRSEREESIFVVSKPPAPVIKLSYGPVVSRVSFKVGFSNSKAGGSSNNFIRNCSLVLRDEQGNIVDTDETKTIFGKAIPQARLMAKNPGIHQITAVCSDSHGTIGTVSETIPVDLGSKDKKSLPILIVNKTINCYLGRCPVDFSRTNTFGKSIKVEYADITNRDSKSVPLFPCGAEVCELNLTRTGVYKFKLVAKFLLSSDANGFHYSDESETIVVVYVSQQPQARQVVPYQTTPPPRQVQPAATAVAPPSVAVSGDDCAGYRCKSAPGTGGFALIAILAILARRIKK